MSAFDNIRMGAENIRTQADSAEEQFNLATAETGRLRTENSRLNTELTAAKAEVTRLTAALEECEGGSEPPPPPPPPAGRKQTIFGAATTDADAPFDVLNQQWGPIRATREYDRAKGFLPINQYGWFDFVKREGFKYLVFSADEQKSTASYREVANGVHDAKIKAMLDSVKALLPGVKGVVCLGNEPNQKEANVDPAVYRAALEHVIDKFGYVPAPGFHWGVAFSNFNVWGSGSTAGKAWLPRRYDGPFCVETHFYGRTDYGDPQGAMGRTLVPTVKALSPHWYMGIGEMSADEEPTNTKKGAWFTKVADFCDANDFAFMLPFDTGVNGSAIINTSENTRKAVKAIATRFAGNNWSA